MTKILPYSCEHAAQDDIYGRGNRLHNRVTKSENLWHCTVCKKERNA